MSSEYDNTGTSDLDLAQFDDDFSEAPIEEREFEDVPDGKYQVKVERAEIVRALSNGNPMLKWTLKILGPTHAGRLLWRNNCWVSDDEKTRERLMSCIGGVWADSSSGYEAREKARQ